jgi:hypothetical protein
LYFVPRGCYSVGIASAAFFAWTICGDPHFYDSILFGPLMLLEHIFGDKSFWSILFSLVTPLICLTDSLFPVALI